MILIYEMREGVEKAANRAGFRSVVNVAAGRRQAGLEVMFDQAEMIL